MYLSNTRGYPLRWPILDHSPQWSNRSIPKIDLLAAAITRRVLTGGCRTLCGDAGEWAGIPLFWGGGAAPFFRRGGGATRISGAGYVLGSGLAIVERRGVRVKRSSGDLRILRLGVFVLRRHAAVLRTCSGAGGCRSRGGRGTGKRVCGSAGRRYRCGREQASAERQLRNGIQGLRGVARAFGWID